MIWNTSSLSIISCFPTGFSCPIKQLLVLPNNNYFAGVAGQAGLCGESLIKVWNFNSGNLVATMTMLPGSNISGFIYNGLIPLTLSASRDLVSIDGSVWDLCTFSRKFTLSVKPLTMGVTATPLGYIGFWKDSNTETQFFDRTYYPIDPRTFADLDSKTIGSNAIAFDVNGDLFFMDYPAGLGAFYIYNCLTGSQIGSFKTQGLWTSIFFSLPSGSRFCLKKYFALLS